MCVNREMFINRRTSKDGYIDAGKEGARLSSTQRQDLKLAVQWVRCRYKFNVEEISEFLGVSKILVKEIFDELSSYNDYNVIPHRSKNVKSKNKESGTKILRLEAKRQRRRNRAQG